jgi:hypothetical protein
VKALYHEDYSLVEASVHLELKATIKPFVAWLTQEDSEDSEDSEDN